MELRKQERIAKAKEESRHTVSAIRDDIAKITAENSAGQTTKEDSGSCKLVGSVQQQTCPAKRNSRQVRKTA